tara:strand:- start:10627 stop:10926 length:300 start_codon:yes stop_codon:yes gene_type:complete
MPLDISDFPSEVQVAFFMFNLLSDNWDGMTGTYMGKDWAQCTQLFEIYSIEDPTTTIYFMKMYESLLVGARIAEQKRKSDAQKRKSEQAGKKYTHNIRG